MKTRKLSTTGRARTRFAGLSKLGAATAVVGLVSLTATSAVVGATTAGASTSSVVLRGTAASASVRQHLVGAVAASSGVDFQVVLNLRDAAAAKALVQAVSTPGSSSFRHYLTAAQWEARYSPTPQTVKSVAAWLSSEKFKVGAISADRLTISASGTAAQVERAFGAKLANYRFNGHVVRMASNDMSVPASLAASVAGTLGINQYLATPDSTSDGPLSAEAAATSSTGKANPFPPAPAAFITAKPCGSYYGQATHTVNPAFGKGYPTTVPDQVCGYEPGQLESAYGVGTTDTGKGVTVAVVDAYGSATINADATKYFKTFAPSIPFANADFSQDDAIPFANESECAASGWATEQAIDIEAVHSMAPDAHILYVGAQDCINGLFTAEQNVIDGSLANVITNSWADTGGDLLDDVASRTAYDNLFMLADATGITVQFSTGDDGDNFDLLGLSAADYPPSSPYVTAVGGTTLKIGSSGQQLGQLGWATGRSFLCTANAENAFPGCTSSTLKTWGPVLYDGGSGGFTSYNYTQPWYQAPVVPSSLALRNEAITGAVPLRVTPDISMEADPATGLLLGLHETFPNGSVRFGLTRYGGTSLASPLLAGVIADADQAAMANGGAPVGFINPAIYRLTGASGAIDDIVPGGKQAQYRTDNGFTYLGPGTKGDVYSFREITFEGTISYCDETGNCDSRPNTLSTSKGYDSMTGLGSIGANFVADLASP